MVTQCFNCQGFNHISSKCTNASKCRKCGEAHSTKDCKVSDSASAVKCSNCAGGHSSSDVSCPKFQEAIKHKESSIVSYACKVKKGADQVDSVRLACTIASACTDMFHAFTEAAEIDDSVISDNLVNAFCCAAAQAVSRHYKVRVNPDHLGGVTCSGDESAA